MTRITNKRCNRHRWRRRRPAGDTTLKDAIGFWFLMSPYLNLFPSSATELKAAHATEAADDDALGAQVGSYSYLI